MSKNETTSSKNIFLNLILNCDFIGKEPKLNFLQRKRIHTIWGGLLCLVIYALMIIGTLYFGQELIFKNKPNIAKIEQVSTEENIIYFKDKDFLFFFGLDSLKNSEIKKYFDIEIKQKEVIRNESKEKRIITNSLEMLKLSNVKIIK